MLQVIVVKKTLLGQGYTMRMRWFIAFTVIVAEIFSLDAFSQSTLLVNAFPRLNFNKPIFLTGSPDSTNRIFVAQQDGIIKVFANDSGAVSATTFLDISNKISSSAGEQGLLGLAFHPRYAVNGYFYVNYTAPSPLRTVIARYSVSPTNPDRADSLSEHKILEVNQPYSNHNGGMIMFGLDKYLYIGMGDGGSGGDPGNRAQNLDSLLGKILRINVDTVAGVRQYGIPADNPFAGNLSGWREEIYAYGFRNPWRFSQDKETTDIWVGDVGQNTWEEIDILEKGKNYGWRIMEGRQCYNPSTGCDTTGLTMPVAQYSHFQVDCSITGGYVYRGHARPDLVGDYIYADYCSGRISRLRYQGDVVISDSVLTTVPFTISSFGMDRDRELYICTYDGGTILRFEASNQVPIQLASFTAHPSVPGKGIVLKWTTLTETNNYGFEVQRKASGESEFHTLLNSFIAGRGTTVEPHAYTYGDTSVTAGQWSYRLKQIDLDGTVHYSEPVSVNVLTDFKNPSKPPMYVLEQNHPNPFNPTTEIRYEIVGARDQGLPARRSGGGGSETRLAVYDLLGREVAVLVNEKQTAGSYSVTFKANGLPSGVYFYRLTSDTFTETKMAVLLK